MVLKISLAGHQEHSTYQSDFPSWWDFLKPGQQDALHTEVKTEENQIYVVNRKFSPFISNFFYHIDIWINILTYRINKSYIFQKDIFLTMYNLMIKYAHTLRQKYSMEYVLYFLISPLKCYYFSTGN